jgi:hypothetical protein
VTAFSKNASVAVKLGVGEFEKELPQPLSQRQAQTHFLVATVLTYPKVLWELGEEVFETYFNFALSCLRRNKVPSPGGQGVTLKWVVDYSPNWEQIKSSEEGRAVREKLVDWAKRYNLEADWVYDRAVKTLQWWFVLPKSISIQLDDGRRLPSIYLYPDEARIAWLNPTKWRQKLDILVTDSDGLPLPAPTLETWEDYRDYVKEQAQEAIDKSVLQAGLGQDRRRLIASVIRRAEEKWENQLGAYQERLGWRRSDIDSVSWRNIVWTVGFQVVGKTYTSLAHGSACSVSTVQRAVRNILKLIDLRPPPNAKPGRRRGSKTSQQAKNSSQIRRSLGRK